MAHSELRIEDITILIDTREQRPLEFKGVKTKKATLVTGDYTIEGLEKIISVERKSLSDLIMCVSGKDRVRFDAEIQRLVAFPCRLIAVEAHWDMIDAKMYRGQTHPNSIKGSIRSWMDRGIPFFFHQDRKVVTDFVKCLMFKRAQRCFRMLRTFQDNLKIQS